MSLFMFMKLALGFIRRSKQKHKNPAPVVFWRLASEKNSGKLGAVFLGFQSLSGHIYDVAGLQHLGSDTIFSIIAALPKFG